MTLLQLRTNHLPPYARRPLRAAALLHDIGKRWDVEIPGAHAAIGANKWQDYAPSWLETEESRLVTFLIESHDFLGRLARGVKEPDYQGAMGPERIREALKKSGIPAKEGLPLLLALNQADVSAVASLRWTLPELDLAVRMVATAL